MTAEIGMLNKYAAVLAADSAVTVNSGSNKEKVYNSANKLFMLSAKHPIGIMIYGSATFLGIPWETIVKQYRQQLLDKKFSYVKEYANDFFKYLETDSNLLENYDANTFIIRKFFSLLNQLTNDLEEGSVPAEEIITKYNNILLNDYTTIEELEKIDDQYFDSINETLKEILHKDYNILDNPSISEDDILNLFYKFIKVNYFEFLSGVVISGFGDKEVFPSLVSYNVEGMLDTIIKKENIDDICISKDNTASIRPFAQTDMVNTFIKGANPELVNWARAELSKDVTAMTTEIATSIQEKIDVADTSLVSTLNEIGKTVLNTYLEKLDAYKQEKHIMPVVDTVAMLGKEDLAAMAENLVGISSLEKRMSLDTETVGGPIDVAVITKGDGFIWYKRKHYFDAKYNNHYFQK